MGPRGLRRRDPRLGSLPWGLLAALMVTLSGLTLLGSAANGPPASSGLPRTHAPLARAAAPPAFPAALPSTLSISARSVNLSSTFWGTTLNNEVHLLPGETDAVNATPVRTIVWPGAMAGEDYDPLTNTHWGTYNGTPVRALTSEAQFVQMCRALHCRGIVQLPAEIDDPAYAAKIVNYTEVNLSYTPAFWMIGNEPELWSHWRTPWKQWATSYTGGPTPTQFGQEVLQYVKAIRTIDNSTPILGLPASGCTCGSWTFEQWIAGVLAVTGDKIQAVAFHEYPAGWLGTGDGSLFDFYGTLQSTAGIPARMIGARAAVESTCGTCNVSVFISELGAALSWSPYGPYAAGFSGALSIASQLTQAMDDNVSNVDLFATELSTTNSWFDRTGYARPDYPLYTDILGHLGSEAFPVDFTGFGSTLYGIATIAHDDHGRRDLLVMNDNITHAVRFAPQLAEFAGGTPAIAWIWNGSIHTTAANGTTWVEPYTTDPVPLEYGQGLPANFTLPPQSMVLFESYPAGGTFVQVNETGVPSSSRWYAEIGPTLYRTSSSNLTLLLPPGTYPVGSIPIPLPLGGRERDPVEELAAYRPAPLTVTGSYTNTTLDFRYAWRVNVSVAPAGAGTVAPTPGYWFAGLPLNLTVTPAPGFAFDRWGGWGPGSFNGTGRTITVHPSSGRIAERARFVPGLSVDFVQLGLPAGAPWSVTVRGFTTQSTSSYLVLWEPNGSYGFHLRPPAGFRCEPKDGAFTVAGGRTIVDVRCTRLTPPPPTFPIRFEITGLPAGMTAPIVVRGTTQMANASGAEFELLNGSYAYQVGYVPGYHASVRHRTFDVRGSPLVVTVPFVPTVYRATFAAAGVRDGLTWSVRVNGSDLVATSAWVTLDLVNGSYPYAIQVPPNYSATPRAGVLVISGGPAAVRPTFELLQYLTGFSETGLPAPALWSVRLGHLTQNTSENRSLFLAPNGTYTFDVHPPAGYYAVPSHGELTVAGSAAPLPIRFVPTSNRPSAALVAQLSTGAISVSIWVGLSAAGGFAATRWLRRRGA